jgi:hypothetical protein
MKNNHHTTHAILCIAGLIYQIIIHSYNISLEVNHPKDETNNVTDRVLKDIPSLYNSCTAEDALAGELSSFVMLSDFFPVVFPHKVFILDATISCQSQPLLSD